MFFKATARSVSGGSTYEPQQAINEVLRLRLRRQKYIIPNTLPNKFENLFLSIRKVEDFSKIPVYKFAKPVFFSLLPLHFSFLFPNCLARVHTYASAHALSKFCILPSPLHLTIITY